MLPLQRIVLRLSSGATLDLEVQKGRAGNQVAFPLAQLVAAFEPEVAPSLLEPPPLCWRTDHDHLFEPLQLREQTDYLLDIWVEYSLADAKGRAVASPAWPLPERLTKFFHRDPTKRWRSSANGVLITGRMNFRSHVGLVQLDVDGATAAAIEVVPRKLGYIEDFKVLLSDIADRFAALLLSAEGGTTTRLSYGTFDEVDPRAALFHLRRLMNPSRLPEAVHHILDAGARRLVSRSEPVGFERFGELDPSLVAEKLADATWHRGGPLSRLFGGFTPTQLPLVRSLESADTPENRYVKAFLQELADLATLLRTRLSMDRLDRSAAEVQAWERTVADWLSHPVWKEVGQLTTMPTNSQMLLRGRGYRDILSADLSLQSGVALPWERGAQLAEGLEGDLRPVDELYQYWCFFVLYEALGRVCNSVSSPQGNLLKWSAGGLRVRLREGEKTRVSYVFKRSGSANVDVHLFYNRTFRRRQHADWYRSGSYSADFRPDYSVLLLPRSAGREHEGHWIHFDAKYRLDLNKWKAEVAPSSGRRTAGQRSAAADTSFKRENLDEMHAYRDALLGSRGAYLLYPASDAPSDVFTRRPGAYASREASLLPGVGAFPLRPAQGGVDSTQLEAFLRGAVERIADATFYQEETGLSTGPLQ